MTVILRVTSFNESRYNWFLKYIVYEVILFICLLMYLLLIGVVLSETVSNKLLAGTS